MWSRQCGSRWNASVPPYTDRRPVYGAQPVDEHWRDLALFYEYFHGDNGAGIGASHQTGWTGLVGLLPALFLNADVTRLLAVDRTEVPR